MAKPSAAKAKAKPQSLRNIHRVDNDSSYTHAWWVVVRRQGQRVTKGFSDGVWGGKRQALAAALAWRDEQIQPLSELAHALWLRKRGGGRDSRSGLVGVGRYGYETDADGRKTGQADYWKATWLDAQGVRLNRTFSVKRWGEHGAKHKAIEARARGVDEAQAAKAML